MTKCIFKLDIKISIRQRLWFRISIFAAITLEYDHVLVKCICIYENNLNSNVCIDAMQSHWFMRRTPLPSVQINYRVTIGYIISIKVKETYQHHLKNSYGRLCFSFY